MPKKIKLENPEIELPDGFESLDELMAKLNEYSSTVPTLQQQVAAFTEFQKQTGDPATFNERLNALIAQKQQEAVAAVKAEGGTKTEQRAAADDVWAQYAELTPQQQAAAMINEVNKGAKQQIDAYLAEKYQEAQKQLGQSTASTQQQFDLLAKALDAKLANPNIDLTKVWGEMTKLAKATPDELMQMAIRGVTAPDVEKQQLEAAKARWTEERDKEDSAKRLSVLNSDSVNNWRKPREETPSLKRDGEDALRNHILGKFLANGELKPEQI